MFNKKRLVQVQVKIEIDSDIFPLVSPNLDLDGQSQ